MDRIAEATRPSCGRSGGLGKRHRAKFRIRSPQEAGFTADSCPESDGPMPPPKVAPVSPQGPPPDTATLPEEPDLPIIDDILPLP
ncbi:hypothetical protein [Acidiphilium iwatense]|uniref:hypothetical protein n=1 Tax=Acidiphilium iwatense TaxID=768198 RepID=UPI001F3A499E|nr:hypothetical protein [Acidiphilium iwatense]